MNFHTFNFRQGEEILNSKKERFDEIRRIIADLALIPLKKGDHKIIQRAFRDKGWEKEERISSGLEKGWQYDAYKAKIAVEIDTKTPCYRSFLKFILGYNLDKIDVGVIIVYDEAEIDNLKQKRFSVTQRELRDLRTIIPVPILLIGMYP